MSVRRAAVALASALIVATPALAARADTRTETARLRAWTVTLTYRVEGAPDFQRLRELRMRADVHGRTAFDRRVPLPPACRDAQCVVLGRDVRLLELKDLGGNAPSALVSLWTGGAHCCSIVEVVPLDGARITWRNFGNPGASVVRYRDVPLFVSEDDRFSYLYTSYAASVRPLQLWLLKPGRFVDVTASYRGLIARDAKSLWGSVQQLARGGEEIRGAFAAWAADACRLSGRSRVEAAAAPLLAAGAFSPPHTDPLGPTGARYARVLLRDLARFGYCR